MKKLYISLLILSVSTYLNAQLSLNAIGTPEGIDFTGFAGAGFQPGGGAGMLNSDTWSATGLSDGDVDFGGTAISGDFARGSTMGLVTIGGIYGVDILGNQGLMVQPTADDFTPGSFILKLKNATGSDIGSLAVSYTIYVLNDANRSSSFNLSYSNDNITYTDVPAVDYTTPETADLTPIIDPQATIISGFTFPNGELFYLRWTSNDVAGAGNRDEIAIDDITVTGNAAVPFPIYTISPTAVTVNEGDLEGSFDVSLSESHDCTLHFGYDPDATATPGFDYGLMGFTLDFTAGGPTTQTVIYGLVDDLTAEGTEYGGILITSADGGCYAGADTAIAITIEDNEIVTPPIASFTTIGATEDEAVGTITGTIELTEAADCELQMYLDGATTMTAGLDYTFALPANFIFTAGGTTSQDFNIPIIDDVLTESDEMLLMNLTVISGTCAIGAIADFEINIIDNDDTPPVYAVYDIADVTDEDADGVALSDGILADLTGIVYGVNLWDGGLQFTLIDNTGGINVFSFDNTFGYTVTEGDEVEVKGVISQFNGLTEVEPDTLIYISSGNALKTPTDVSDLNESTESDLVIMDLNGYYVADPLQWLGDGSSFNIDITNDVNTYVIRVDDNTELANMAYTDIFYDGDWPNDGFFITGIGSQYDTETPFTEGYELLPRYVTDFIVGYESISQLNPSQISIYPNPTTSNLILSGKENIEWIEIINQLGETIKTISVYNFQTNIDVKNIPAGLYFMKIKTDTGIYSSNFIKN